jgi:hypothetical protein
MASATATYQPRATERGILHSVVREHLETFLAEAARAGREGVGLPEFVEQEFRDFLTCGVLAHGFARVRCDTCAFERLVPFSCKGRGLCPSCGGRRMSERAAHLVAVDPEPLRKLIREVVSTPRGECQRPDAGEGEGLERPAIPIALGITLIVYAAVAVSALAGAGASAVGAAAAPLATAVEAGRLAWLSPAVRIGATVASLGVLLSLIVGVSRTAFAMASNRDLPAFLSAVHPRYRVPHRAELVVGGIVASLAAVARGE